MGTTIVNVRTEPKTTETDDIIDVRIPKTSKGEIPDIIDVRIPKTFIKLGCAVTSAFFALAIALLVFAAKMLVELL